LRFRHHFSKVSPEEAGNGEPLLRVFFEEQPLLKTCNYSIGKIPESVTIAVSKKGSFNLMIFADNELDSFS